jgi:hypothetical protein
MDIYDGVYFQNYQKQSIDRNRKVQTNIDIDRNEKREKRKREKEKKKKRRAIVYVNAKCYEKEIIQKTFFKKKK